MDASFVGVEKTGDPQVRRLAVTEGITGGKGQLFGGCLLGTAAAMVEESTGRPALWVTTQFAAGATSGDVITLRAETVAQGRSVTQAIVHGTIDGQHHSTTLMATGARRFPTEVPPVPRALATGALATAARSTGALAPPEECEPLDFDPGEGGLNRRMDVRSVEGSATEPRRTSRLWFRFEGTTGGDLYSLAIASDFFPPALSAAIGSRIFGASLDNTIRLVDRAEAEWLLVDMCVDSVRNGIAHGTNTVWTQDGRLLATATQTCTVSELT